MSNQGWECPKCGRCYSPYMPQCSFCPAQIGTTTDNVTSCIHQWEATTAGERCLRCGLYRPILAWGLKP